MREPDLSLLACPLCRDGLTMSGALLRSSCGAEFEIVEGIPILVVTVSPLSRRQAEWFDHEADPEWEIERPEGSPALYSWLLHEKFRRAVKGIELEGKTALCVCAGSGMDAEFLSKAGARVIALDISLGAIRRSIERSRRHLFDIIPVVGDVAQLPFRDAAIDVVYVHDGLHHLEDPLRGLAEMTRVSSHVICVVEPANAGVTRVAIRVGLAQQREEAGNRVARLSPSAVEEGLRRHGFAIVRSERYAMFYRHTPGRIVRALSHQLLMKVSISAFRALNSLLGRYGNKLTVVAVRR